MSTAESVSLLWPRGESTSINRQWQNSAVNDLGLENVVRALDVDGKHEKAIKAVILSPCTDAETIYYRQEIIEDLLSIPELLQQLMDLLPLMSDLTYYASMADMEALPFQKTIGRLNELELYAKIVRALSSLLSLPDNRLRSSGLRTLRDMIFRRLQEPIFKKIEQELPDITSKLGKLQSVTLGINLDHNLKPIEATILSVNTEPFRGVSFLKNLLGDLAGFQGITPLQSVPMKPMTTLDGRLVSSHQRSDPLLTPLFKDLDRVINDTMRPIAAALREFIQVNTQFLAVLEPEIVFYLGAVRLINDLTAHGLPMCRAEVSDMDACICVVRDCYNLNLALRQMFRQPDANLASEIVGNDVEFGDNGRILIITGPNQGGKTTYIQALALAQVLFQAGLYVPGSSACISPVDAIYTHFPVEEKPNTEAGRFGEEAQRLSEIFAQATRHSLILLNESLASTASGESLYLARDIVRCFRLLGARVAYTTHMHELAASADEINSTTQGNSKVISLVATAQTHASEGGSSEVTRTYKIIASPPMGRSYAQELAAQYGISFDRIMETLSARQAIDADMAHQAMA